MFREPLQRAISGWNHLKHSCETAEDIHDYVDCVKDCQTQLLSGKSCGRSKPAGEEDYARAKQRLEKLGFVGLTSQWELSVCLFHAMYGGICKPVEFSNVRPGVKHRHDLSAYKEKDYGLPENFTASGFDDRLYAEAEGLFWDRVEEYGVTRQSCAEIHCRTSRKIFDPPPPTTTTAPPETDILEVFRTTADSRFDWPGRIAYDED